MLLLLAATGAGIPGSWRFSEVILEPTRQKIQGAFHGSL
jgi:hypothetical protein